MKPTTSGLPINIHDVYTSRSLDHLKKFLFKRPSNIFSSCVTVADINRKDLFGRTLLHKLAASENESEALAWLKVLSQHPQLKVNTTDTESGWTALHRALFVGNLSFAKVLVDDLGCDLDIRDHEGMSALALYNSTIHGACPSNSITPELKHRTELFTWGTNQNFVLGTEGAGDRHHPERIHFKHMPSSSASSAQVNQFSSMSVSSVAMSRLHTAVVTTTGELWVCGFGSGGRLGLGWSTNKHTNNTSVTAQTQLTFARVKGALVGQKVKTVALGQDHTVVITQSGQVYTFGMNRFGQLGYGVEALAPSLSDPSNPLTCNQSSAAIQVDPKRVVGPLKKEIALGATASRWHTAVFTDDALYTWGAHQGQLGYHNSGSSPHQCSPRKVSAATSPILQLTCTDYVTAYLCRNSEVYILRSNSCIKLVFPYGRFPSAMSVYQPRGKGALGHSYITKISAFGDSLVAVSSMGDIFALDLERAHLQTEANSSTTSSVISNGLHHTTPGPVSNSLASQNLKPQRVWKSGKRFTAATDAVVGMNGSIVFCTKSGHVYVHSKRSEHHSNAKRLPARSSELTSHSLKNCVTYKSTRIPHLERIVKVDANPTGAFSAIRQDAKLSEIKRTCSDEERSLASTLVSLLSHLKNYVASTPELHTLPLHPTCDTNTSACKNDEGQEEDQSVSTDDHDSVQEDADPAFNWDIRVGCALYRMSMYWDNEQALTLPLDNGDVILLAEQDKPILVHSFVLSSRSQLLRKILSEPQSPAGIVYHQAGSKSIDCNGTTRLVKLPALEFLDTPLASLILFVHYLYTDQYPCIWDIRVSRSLHHHHPELFQFTGPSNHSLNTDLHNTKLGLERLAHVTNLEALGKSLGKLGKVVPEPCLAKNFEAQLLCSPVLSLHHDLLNCKDGGANGTIAPDIELVLKDGEVIGCHSILMRAQCPFFQMMFEEDEWVFTRREVETFSSSVSTPRNIIKIDMRHFSKPAMEVVVRHIYTDKSTELFNQSDFGSLDEYVDFVVDVLAIANELLMDKLKRICSIALRDFINLNNVTSLTAEADFYKADALKETCMNYMLCNLETMFQDKALIDIPAELLVNLSRYLKNMQESKFPRTRSKSLKFELLKSNQNFLSELDLPKSGIGSTPRHWKQFFKSATNANQQQLPQYLNTIEMFPTRSALADSELKNGDHLISPSSIVPSLDLYSSHSPASIDTHSLGTSVPRTSKVSSAALQSPVVDFTPPRRAADDGDLADEPPFVMDELDPILPEIETSKKPDDLEGATRPTVWASTTTQRMRTDLRSIMSAEKPRNLPGSSISIHPTIAPNKFPLGVRRAGFESGISSGRLSQREKRRISLETAKAQVEPLAAQVPAWRSTSITNSNSRLPEPGKDFHPPNPSVVKGAALTKPLMSPSSGNGGFGRDATAEQASPLNGKRVVSSGLAMAFAPGSVPASIITSAQSTPQKLSDDPASAVGAAVITPIRMPSGGNPTTGGSPALRSHRTAGGQDTAWTNYASTSSTFSYTSGLASAAITEYDSSYHRIGQGCSPDATSRASLSVIQYQQESESLAIRKNKPSLLKIQEEENLRVLEKKREEEFLKWFEQESRKHQQPSYSCLSNSKSGHLKKSVGRKPSGGRASKGAVDSNALLSSVGSKDSLQRTELEADGNATVSQASAQGSVATERSWKLTMASGTKERGPITTSSSGKRRAKGPKLKAKQNSEGSADVVVD